MGYKELNTMITWYHNPYQKEHLKKLKMKKLAEWVEYRIQIWSEDKAPEKVKKFSNLIMKRYNLKPLTFKSTNEVVPYLAEMFDLLNKTYNTLQTFVPIQQYQVDHYKEKYLRYIHPDFIKSVVDSDGKLVAFAILFNDLQSMFNKRGIKEVETNPELIENTSIQAFWKNYESELHKKRSTFTKEI